MRVRAVGRWNEARQPWLARPYSAPPVAGKSCAKSVGVVTTVVAGSRAIESPARANRSNVLASHCAIADGRGIDQAEQALCTRWDRDIGVASILRAHIDGGRGRQALAAQQVVEFRAVIA